MIEVINTCKEAFWISTVYLKPAAVQLSNQWTQQIPAVGKVPWKEPSNVFGAHKLQRRQARQKCNLQLLKTNLDFDLYYSIVCISHCYITIVFQRAAIICSALEFAFHKSVPAAIWKLHYLSENEYTTRPTGPLRSAADMYCTRREEVEEQSLKLAPGQPLVWSVSAFIFLASAYEGGWPVLSLTVPPSH